MNWRNLPIPETIVIPLAAGIALYIFFPRPLFPAGPAWYVGGTLLLLAGVLLIAWALRTAGAQDLESPGRLVTAGPYAHSRNPMYVAWFLIFVAGLLFLRTLWLALLLPVAGVLTHFLAVLPEERQLEALFGAEYRRYRSRVRRYF